MKTLETKELLETTGGGLAKWILGGIGIGIVFVASVVYGFIHPNKC